MQGSSLSIQTQSGYDVGVSEPVVYISILSKSTTGKNSRVGAGQSDYSPSFTAGTSGSDLLTHRLVALKVTADVKRVAQAEITLYNEDQALNDTAVMQKGTLLKISWGYTGYMGRVRTFKVHKIKGSTARVSNFGQLKIIALMQTYDLHGAVRSKCYMNTSIVGIARQIAKRYGVPLGDMRLGPDDLKRATYHQVNQTDAQFLQSLAQKLGWTFQVEDGIFTFAPVDVVDKNEPLATFTYFTDEQGWIKRFEPTTSVMSLPGSVTVKSRDPISGKRVQHTQTIENRKKKSLCKYTELIPAERAGSQIGKLGKRIHRSKAALKPGVVPSSQVVSVPGKNSRQVQQEATTRHTNVLLESVKARMIVVGDPDLWHSVLITVEGVGKMLSGLCRIFKCQIYLDHRGFEVDCKIRREGVGTLGKNNKPRSDQTAKSQRVNRRMQGRVFDVTDFTPLVITGTVKKTKFKRR